MDCLILALGLDVGLCVGGRNEDPEGAQYSTDVLKNFR